MNLFVHPHYFVFGLFLFACLVLIYFASEKKRRKRLSLLTSNKLFSNLIPEWSPARQKIKFGLFLLALFFLLSALARPQWGSQKRMTTPTGIDILVAVDVSKSMLAEDVKPNRLERVKLSMGNLLEKVQGDRLGLVAFSGSSFLQCPLTLDHQAFLKTLNDLEVGLIKRPGTNLALPIDEAARSFSKDDSDRFLVLLSDGEDLEGEGLKRAKAAVEEGIKIFTIGIGSKGGARIPTDPIGKSNSNFLLDRDGKTILSKLDEQSLKSIADVTGGKYFPLGPTGEGLEYTLQHLQTIGQQKKKTQLSMELPIERFQPFILLSLLFLIVEIMTASGKTKLFKRSNASLCILLCFFGGCLKKDNVKLAEEAIQQNDSRGAAFFYEAEINASKELDQPIDSRLFLNAGLAYLEAGDLDKADYFLEKALELSIDNPELQSITLNSLGNSYYKKTNLWLDQQNVAKARESWKQALEYYEHAIQLDGNKKASENLNSLKRQIEERIRSLVTTFIGGIWRDLNGDGKIQKDEPFLNGYVFWDKDGNGEHNETGEPKINSDENGKFKFEWISGNYPVSIQIGSVLADKNTTKNVRLLPLFPPPPPPMNPAQTKNHFVMIEKPGTIELPIPYRAAPSLQGKIWSDQNGNGILDDAEGPYDAGTLYLDQNGNFQFDENETSFKPNKDGTFFHVVPPGQYSLCLKTDNQDANVTFPIDEKKAYLTWVNFEAPSMGLDFGVKDDSGNESENEPSEPQENSENSNQVDSSPNEQDETDSDSPPEENLAQEINALYERLLQEMESKSEPLEQDLRMAESPNSGRDY